MYREASGTSGMTAAMNGSINLSLPDGWVPEFAKDKENSFVIQPADDNLPHHEKDMQESKNLVDIIDNVARPMYYKDQKKWISILKKAAADVSPAFDSGRMADEYYREMYNF
jgi:starch phosphorylase